MALVREEKIKFIVDTIRDYPNLVFDQLTPAQFNALMLAAKMAVRGASLEQRKARLLEEIKGIDDSMSIAITEG